METERLREVLIPHFDESLKFQPWPYLCSSSGDFLLDFSWEGGTDSAQIELEGDTCTLTLPHGEKEMVVTFSLYSVTVRGRYGFNDAGDDDAGVTHLIDTEEKVEETLSEEADRECGIDDA